MVDSSSPPLILCANCGKPLRPRASFCVHCGRAVAPVKKPRKKRGPIIAIVLSVVLVLGIALSAALLLSGRDSEPGRTSPNMDLGAEKRLVKKTIKRSGGEIEIEDSGTVLDGMVLDVPSGAYDESTQFEISMTEINSHDFGDIFNPVTPLITIDNGGDFANEPMTLEIPIEKDDDEFAMAFYYDTKTGELEGIPTVELENDHITIVTCHFCDLVVTKEKPERITETDSDEDFVIDSGFEPGRDDFQMHNYGSYECPLGHCAGQSIGAMYYYLNHDRIGWDANLNGLFDNNGREATPLFDMDDATAMRLCSVLQTYYKTKWPTVTRFSGDAYIACAYAISLTGKPQYLSLTGHAVVAYKVTTDGLYIADPNYPGEERMIKYSNGALNPYYSGKNYEEATTNSTEYTKFGYYGLFSLINKEDVAAQWQKLLNGEDPGAGVFPEDLTFTACYGKDPDSGGFINTPMSDGMVVTEAQITEAGQGGLLVYTTLGSGDKVLFYNGYTLLAVWNYTQTNIAECVYELRQGENDLGMLYLREVAGSYSIVNFYRFTVHLQAEATLSVSPDSATAFPGDAIPFTVTATGAPEDASYLWDFGDGTWDETDDTTYTYEYDAEGTYDGTVTLYSAENPDTPLAEANFYVCVLAEETTAPTDTSSTTASLNYDEALIGEWYSEYSDITLIFYGGGTGFASGPYGSSSTTYIISDNDVYVTGTNVDTNEEETIIVNISEYDGYLVLEADGEVFYKTG